MAAPRAIDVFYSYAHEDEELRDELNKHLRLLERQGIIAGWHDREIGPGKEWDKLIDGRLETARIILLLVSPDFIASDYCYEREMKRALVRHEAGDVRVIPVILRPCLWHDAPFAKLQVAPTDGTPITSWTDRDAAFQDVAHKIKAVAWELRWSGLRPTACNLPRRNHYFTGRDALLRELYQKLAAGEEAVVQPVAITAADGVGKTELALEYAYRYRERYDVIWWLKADTQPNLVADMGALAHALKVGEHQPNKPETAVTALHQWLEEDRGWLLVFDNVARPIDLKPLLPKRIRGHVVITSPTPAWGRLASRLPLDLWTREESIDFLIKRTEDADTAGSDRVAEILGDLPLALEQAAAYIERTEIGLADYANAAEQEQGGRLWGAAPDLEQRVGVACSLSLARVESESPAAAQLMCLRAFLAPGSVPLEAVRAGGGSLPEPLRGAVKAPQTLAKTLDVLGRYSLAHTEEESFWVHPVTQSAVRDSLCSAAGTWVNIADKFCDATKEKETSTTPCLPLEVEASSQNRETKSSVGELPRSWAFGSAFAAALLLYSFLMLLHAVGYLSKTEDLGADLGMYLFKQGLVSQESDNLYAFIDVDDRTYSEWDEPLLMPRDKLLCLINFARASRAKLIVVDFDLSYPGGAPNAEATLASSLKSMSADAPCSVLPGQSSAQASLSTVPIILYRGISHYHWSPRSRIGRLRPSFEELETAVSESDHLFWASTTLQVDPDGIVRRWMLWREACDRSKDGEGVEEAPSVEVVLSVPLAAQAILRGRHSDQEEITSIVKFLQEKCARSECTDASGGGDCGKLRIGDRSPDLSNQAARILYTIPWIPIGGALTDGDEQSLEVVQPPMIEYKGSREPIIVPVRADEVTKLYCASNPEVAAGQTGNRCQRAPKVQKGGRQSMSVEDTTERTNVLKERIVIIGGSYAAARDIYATPVREPMPGAVVAMNAIQTLAHHGILGSPNWLVSSMLFFIQASIVAAVHCFCRKRLYTLIVYTLLFGMMFIVSGMLLNSGLWIDTSLATLGVVLYRGVFSRASKVMSFGKNKWNRVITRRSSVLSVPLVLVLSALPQPTLAQPEWAEGGTAGYVEAFNKPSKEYEILRHGGGALDVYYFAPVYSGDKIVIKSSRDDAFISLRRSDGRARKIHRDESPYRVLSPERTPPAIDVFVRIGKAITTWWDRNPTFRDAVSRGEPIRGNKGGPLSVEILDHHDLAVVEGIRDFSLSWRGGSAPFTVRLVRIGKLAPELERRDLRERRLGPEQVILTVGQYRIEVRDTGLSKPVIRQLPVVPESELPVLPPEVRLMGFSPQAKRTNHAIWLASQDSGRWALESYLQVAGLAETYELAGIFGGMLARGSVPMTE